MCSTCKYHNSCFLCAEGLFDQCTGDYYEPDVTQFTAAASLPAPANCVTDYLPFQTYEEVI